MRSTRSSPLCYITKVLLQIFLFILQDQYQSDRIRGHSHLSSNIIDQWRDYTMRLSYHAPAGSM